MTPLQIFIFSKNPPSSAFRVAMYCGDLGINRKNSQPDMDSSAARYKMYKCVATHKAPRIHPVKIELGELVTNTEPCLSITDQVNGRRDRG